MNALEGSPACCTVCEIDTTPSAEREEIVGLFKALSDPTRYEIFRLIASQPDSICVCHITDRFDVSQPTISHHLRILREAGLLTVSRRGTWAYYEVDRSGVERLQGVLGHVAPVELVGSAI
jgi:ArsR family transcriptional regulator